MTLRAGLVAVVLGLSLAVLPATPAWACSCGEADPAARISLAITDSAVEAVPNPWGGDPSDDSGTVDLRGSAMEVLSEVPAALEGRDLEAVPVLAAVLRDPNMQDSCGTPQVPAVGSDLRVDGTVTDETGELIIYSGPCSGTFTVTAAPEVSPPDDSASLALVAGGAAAAMVVAVLAVRALRSRGS